MIFTLKHYQFQQAREIPSENPSGQSRALPFPTAPCEKHSAGIGLRKAAKTSMNKPRHLLKGLHLLTFWHLYTQIISTFWWIEMSVWLPKRGGEGGVVLVLSDRRQVSPSDMIDWELNSKSSQNDVRKSVSFTCYLLVCLFELPNKWMNKWCRIRRRNKYNNINIFNFNLETNTKNITHLFIHSFVYLFE